MKWLIWILLLTAACGDEEAFSPDPRTPDDSIPPVDSTPQLPNWVRVISSGAPSPRALHAMAYDAGRERLVVFGGSGGSGRLNDTWEYDSEHWVEIITSTTPPAREFQAQPEAVYDSARGRVVLFGGSDGSTLFGDTWEYDGGNWAEIQTDSAPSPRRGHAMAYDTQRERTVLFGGVTDDTVANDTWEFDGVDWIKVGPTPGIPSARAFHAMAYDGARNCVVLYGGSTSAGLAQDTWEFDGVDWARRVVVVINSLQTREKHALAYDPTSNETILFGGQTTGSVLGGGTFLYDGTSWSEIETDSVPANRLLHTMAYDGRAEKVVLFGGVLGPGLFQNDMWELHR